MTIEIEARPYGPDSTPEEIQALKKRASLAEGDTILFRETPVQTPFQLEQCFEQIRELAEPLERWFLLIDLTEVTSRPSAPVRACLAREFQKLRPGHLQAVAIFTGKNYLMNITAQFILSKTLKVPLHITKTREQAMEHLNNARSG